MTDMGGTHGWLRDAGGGSERAMRTAGPIVRPTNEQLCFVLGTEQVRRHLITDAVERITWIGPSAKQETAILKVGGFLRDPRERLLYREVLGPADGAPGVIQTIDRHESNAQVDNANNALSSDWLVLEDVTGRAGDPGNPTDVAAMYRQLAGIHKQHPAPLRRRMDSRTPPGIPLGAAQHTDISDRLHKLLASQPLTLRSKAEGLEHVATLGTLVDRAIADRETWEFSRGARATFETLILWANTGLDRLLASGPVGLLHGDFQRNNWILEMCDSPASRSEDDHAAEHRVRVLDWESAALGPGVIDLYYLAPDTAGAGHAPSGALADMAIDAYVDQANVSGSVAEMKHVVRDAIVWGSIASTIIRLADYFSELPQTRTPKTALPGVALDLLEYAASTARRTGRT